jgi:hypothetical protein
MADNAAAAFSIFRCSATTLVRWLVFANRISFGVDFNRQLL